MNFESEKFSVDQKMSGVNTSLSGEIYGAPGFSTHFSHLDQLRAEQKNRQNRGIESPKLSEVSPVSRVLKVSQFNNHTSYCTTAETLFKQVFPV